MSEETKIEKRAPKYPFADPDRYVPVPEFTVPGTDCIYTALAMAHEDVRSLEHYEERRREEIDVAMGRVEAIKKAIDANHSKLVTAIIHRDKLARKMAQEIAEDVRSGSLTCLRCGKSTCPPDYWNARQLSAYACLCTENNQPQETSAEASMSEETKIEETTKIEEDDELYEVEPCPFCGRSSTLSIFGNDVGRTVVNCTECNVSGPHPDECADDENARAVAMWNRRAHPINREAAAAARASFCENFPEAYAKLFPPKDGE